MIWLLKKNILELLTVVQADVSGCDTQNTCIHNLYYTHADTDTMLLLLLHNNLSSTAQELAYLLQFDNILTL